MNKENVIYLDREKTKNSKRSKEIVKKLNADKETKTTTKITRLPFNNLDRFLKATQNLENRGCILEYVNEFPEVHENFQYKKIINTIDTLLENIQNSLNGVYKNSNIQAIKTVEEKIFPNENIDEKYFKIGIKLKFGQKEKFSFYIDNVPKNVASLVNEEYLISRPNHTLLRTKTTPKYLEQDY